MPISFFHIARICDAKSTLLTSLSPSCSCNFNRRFIRPELVPVQYGGLSRAGDLENGPPKPASEFTIKGGEKVFLEIDGIEVYTPNFALPLPIRNATTHFQIVSICNSALLRPRSAVLMPAAADLLPETNTISIAEK